MYSADINHLRNVLSLSSLQRKVVIGTLLGDGYLYPTVSGKYAYLRVSHGPKQRNYVWWKYNYSKIGCYHHPDTSCRIK